MHSIYLKNQVMSGPGGIFELFLKKTEELNSKPENIQHTEATDFIRMYVESNKQQVKESQQAYNNFKKEHSKNYPNLYSDLQTRLKQNKFRQKVLEKISKKIIEAKASMHEVMLYIMDQTNPLINALNAYYLDPVASIEKPNKAMVETIEKTISKEKDRNIFVYAGDKHINIFHTKYNKLTDKNKQMIQHLYDKVDHLSPEKPPLVLSCKL